MKVLPFRTSPILARMIVNRLRDIITMYGFVTVADYYDIIGITPRYSDNKMGWKSLDRAGVIINDNDGVCELTMPRAYRIE